jgi:OOP family OmpA-OmpF porin
MRRYACSVGFVVSLVTLCLVLIRLDLYAQDRGTFTDFRGRGNYTEEDIARSLFPEAQPEARTRGIGPVQSPQAPAAPSAKNPSIALNVLFEFNSDKILPAYHDDINMLGRVLTSPQYSAYRVEIEGHTDSIGSDGYNQVLSQRRADSVRRYLVQTFAIRSDRLSAKGLGKRKPIASNDTPDGRSQNRRVEVVNLGTR